MNCMRCGKETQGKAVFCPECLEDMERYPVKPGTIIHIPQHREADQLKPAKKRRELSTDEQLKNAQTLIQFLVVSILALLTALVITGILLLYVFSNPPQPSGTESPQSQPRSYATVTNPVDQ